MSTTPETRSRAQVIATWIATIALVLACGAGAGLLGLELPEPANSMVHSLLWIVLAVLGTVALRRRWVSARFRLVWMAGVVVVIGVLMGTQPNAMGSVTHGIFGLLENGLVFNDYLIGMAVVTAVMVVASKAVCSWACHLGTLQELLFRFNRDRKDRRGVLRQAKLPFALTMTVRVVIFALFVVVAVLWSVDISLPFDPHRLYRLTTMATIPALFTMALTLGLSPFVYRPWCQLACPLGLLGWLTERIAVLRIRVDRGTCNDCKSCVEACPGTAMEGILDGKAIRADCWSCGTCIERCPTGSIGFESCLGKGRGAK